MLKFRCQHCGQRIAVPSRHLGRLVTCSECGKQTHPLAEQIVAAGPSSTASPGACDNCGLPIGRLQTSFRWERHVVCGACYHRLSGESRTGGIVAAPATATALEPQPAPVVVTRARHDVEPRVEPPKPLVMEMRERVMRALIVFVVASVALYGALSLLRDIAGLIAVAAVAVIALLSLYGLFRGSIAARRRLARPTDLAPVQRSAA